MWPTHPTVSSYFSFLGELIAEVVDIERAVVNDRRANTY